MERVTLTDDYLHAEGRHYKAGDHVLPADVVAGARAAGVVAAADDVASPARKPARGKGGKFAKRAGR